MRIVLRLGVISLCCALFACGCAVIEYETFEPRRPAVNPESVQVFLFRPPDRPFEVIGTLRLEEEETAYRRDLYSVRPITERSMEEHDIIPQIQRQAGKRGADVVWFQSDTIKESDCSDPETTHWQCYRHFVEGVLGRCRE